MVQQFRLVKYYNLPRFLSIKVFFWHLVRWLILFDHNLPQKLFLSFCHKARWLVGSCNSFSKGFSSQGCWSQSTDDIFFTYMEVSWNRGTPKSSILIGFFFINHPVWGTPISGNLHIHFGIFPNGDLLFLAAVLYIICSLGVPVGESAFRQKSSIGWSLMRCSDAESCSWMFYATRNQTLPARCPCLRGGRTKVGHWTLPQVATIWAFCFIIFMVARCIQCASKILGSFTYTILYKRFRSTMVSWCFLQKLLGIHWK